MCWQPTSHFYLLSAAWNKHTKQSIITPARQQRQRQQQGPSLGHCVHYHSCFYSLLSNPVFLIYGLNRAPLYKQFIHIKGFKMTRKKKQYNSQISPFKIFVFCTQLSQGIIPTACFTMYDSNWDHLSPPAWTWNDNTNSAGSCRRRQGQPQWKCSSNSTNRALKAKTMILPTVQGWDMGSVHFSSGYSGK